MEAGFAGAVAGAGAASMGGAVWDGAAAAAAEGVSVTVSASTTAAAWL